MTEKVESVILPHGVDVTYATSVAEIELGEVTGGGTTRMLITQHHRYAYCYGASRASEFPVLTLWAAYCTVPSSGCQLK